MSTIKQLPARVDVECVAGDPFTATFAAASGVTTFSSPACTMTTSGGDSYTTDPGVPTASASGASLSTAWSATDTAALNTTTKPKTYKWSTKAVADGGSSFQWYGGTITVHPVGTSGISTSSTISADVVVGGVSVSATVIAGTGAAGSVTIADAGSYFTATQVEGALQELGASNATDKTRWATINFAEMSYNLANPGSGDHTSLLQDAIDEAADGVPTAEHNSAINVPLAGHVYNASGLTIPDGVMLVGDGSVILANASGWMVTISGDGAGMRDIVLNGNDSGQGASGIKVTGIGARLDRLSVNDLDGAAYEIASGSLYARLNDCHSQGAHRAANDLAAITGALLISGGSDHLVRGSSFGTGRNTPGSASTGGYAYGIALTGGSSSAAHHFVDTWAEVSDGGWYVNAADVHLANCRAEFNYHDGFVFNAASGTVVGCAARSNGRTAANTYDGFVFTNLSSMRVDACRAVGNGNTHRYGFYDDQTSAFARNVFGPTNFATNYGTAAINRTTSSNGGAVVIPATGVFYAASAGATTLDLQTNGWPHTDWELKSTSSTNFTNFTNGHPGMVVQVLGDGYTTFVHAGTWSTGIRTISGSNTLAEGGKIYRFVKYGNTWIMTGVSA